MLAEDVRREAIEYVETVVARAEGAPPPEPAPPPRRPLASRLVPGPVKRGFVRLLIYALRHPYDHLSHPTSVEFEHQIAELRAAVHAANRRADQAAHAVQRARPELESWRRAVQAALADLEARVDELERRR